MQQKRSQRADRRSLRPFVGVDGEGGDIDDEHVYLLLRAGEHALETGKALTPYECFEFLADLPKDRYYVAFAFNYDVSMMIRHLPPDKVAALFDRAKREIINDGKRTGRYYPVQVGHGQFDIDYMPGKEFRVRRHGRGKYTYISDVFSYFQASFVSTLTKWFGDDGDLKDVIDRIAEGKALRHEFGAVTEYEREYNKLECVVLALLMERFRAVCTALNIHPRKWQGPGGLVDAVFTREGLPRNTELNVEPAVLYWANHAYFGGRFEVSTFGDIQQKVWQYDINSAYASYYKRLPCLQHGRWKPIRKLPTDGEAIYFAEVSFSHPAGLLWNTLPVRSGKGTLLFPNSGRGWYWCHELAAAKRHGAKVYVRRGYRYVKECDCENFNWVYALYDQRKAVGKNSGEGKVLKIVLATIYGKLAQSKGHPVFANPIWSGLVVSYCRATLIDAALSVDGGRDVLMLATDGMFCTSSRPTLSVGTGLGQWEMTEHDSMFIVMSGVYFLPTEKPKTRGIPQSKVIEYEQQFRDTWSTWRHANDPYGNEPKVNVPLRVFVGGCLANARRKPWQCGTWRDEFKAVGFTWNTKRTSPAFRGTRMVTKPVHGSPTLQSRPPDWMIGGPLENLPSLNDLELDQPDWGDHMLWDEDEL